MQSFTRLLNYQQIELSKKETEHWEKGFSSHSVSLVYLTKWKCPVLNQINEHEWDKKGFQTVTVQALFFNITWPTFKDTSTIFTLYKYITKVLYKPVSTGINNSNIHCIMPYKDKEIMQTW